ncbi:MAG: nitrogen regulatory protein 1 [Candidatus Atribacteria bacterium]|jgi:nitrogen regulatory protein P-II 1|uniref:P-II family nitrogen regulator n=1 Tax=Thermatribacter velox TaxID=3039681 RepID=A0ABZ2YDW6_9BACT|nr:nitrogen regulatory protein 1 [Candidatus Atribacteria bacterium]
MIKLEILIREEKAQEVVGVLEQMGYPGVTIYQVEGRGSQRGLVEQFRGRAYEILFLPKVKIEAIVRDADKEKLIEAITKVARTGEIGDGKIFVSPVMDIVRIRTGESGEQAL